VGIKLWFKKKVTKEEFEELKQILTKSFNRIKVDIDSLNNKVNTLENRIQQANELEIKIDKIEDKVEGYIEKYRELIKYKNLTVKRNAPKLSRVKQKQIIKNALCKICGSDYRLGVHHIDGNPSNEDISNLTVLCVKCHNKIHHGMPRLNLNRLDCSSKRLDAPKQSLDIDTLSNAEKELLKVLMENKGLALSYKDLSKQLNKSVSTVKNQLLSLMKRTNVIERKTAKDNQNRYGFKENIKVKSVLN